MVTRSKRSLGFSALRLTSYVRNSGRASAHKLGGTLSTSVSALRPTFFALLNKSKDRSLMTLTVCVTSAPRGRTLMLGISCAADFLITRHFSRRTSSPIFSRLEGGVPLHCDDSRTAVHSLSLLETRERTPAPHRTRL